MHYLQKAILDKLRYEQPLTYTALMPDGIESSHFRYHLKMLMGDGLIQKEGKDHYVLSDKGNQEVDYLSSNRTTLIRTPKIITYTLLTHGDKLLLYKKPKEPYRNLWGLIGGKVHFGEDTQLAAQREVHEKTGLAVTLPDLCGIADIVIDKHDEPLSHVIAYVHSAAVAELPTELPKELALVSAADLPAYDVIPDLLPLLDEINNQPHPFTKQLRVSLTA